MEAKANNRPGRTRSIALSCQASSEVPDQKPYAQRADAHKRPASEAGVSLPVLFLIIVVAEVVEDPGPQKEVREGAVPNAVPGAVHPRTRPLLTTLCRGLCFASEEGLLFPGGLANPPPPRPPPPLCASAMPDAIKTATSSAALMVSENTTTILLARLAFGTN